MLPPHAGGQDAALSGAGLRVKICGLSTADSVDAAVTEGAAYLGFVFFAKSPRNIDLASAAALASRVPPGRAKVALTVNADNATLDQIVATVPLDILQLHGREGPERIAEVRRRYGLPVMKAVGLRDADDLPALDAAMQVADQVLVDAKPPEGAALPGGNGLAFDWRLLAGRRWPIPWMLAGGLTVDTVAEAVARTGARQLDLSSGVESAPGIKDPAAIAAFMRAARTISRPTDVPTAAPTAAKMPRLT